MNESDTFEEFWESVLAFANYHELPVDYVEEEFIIDGELVETGYYKNEPACDT